MYFAQNPTDLHAAGAFFAERLNADADIYWAALVDSAFDHGVADAAPHYRGGVNCYEADIPLNDLQEVAPYLIPLWPDERGMETLNKLLTHCSGRPMLSVLASPLPAETIAARWLPLHRPYTPDKQRMLLRFADTRVLAGLPAHLTPTQWGGISWPVAHWYYVNRAGAVATCSIPVADQETKVTELQLTQKQLDNMVEACEPDAALDFIADYSPELIPRDVKPVTLHRFITEVLALARKSGVDSWPDKMALVTADLLTRGAIRANPQLEGWLRAKEWHATGLSEALLAKGWV